jgi:hypothetical protein
MHVKNGATIFIWHFDNEMVILMGRMDRQWLKFWMCNLDSFQVVKDVVVDCETALTRINDVVRVMVLTAWRH